LKEAGLRVFVESGTYLGDTTAFLRPSVDRVITVELAPTYAVAARQRFAADPGITVIEGDALNVLPALLEDLTEPALIYLDGHYSGGETARGNLDEPAAAILRSLDDANVPEGSVLVVDDLRHMGDPGLPELDELTAAARAAFPNARIRVGLDSLIIFVERNRARSGALLVALVVHWWCLSAQSAAETLVETPSLYLFV
jgi:predicted O-methyltransferase YrrM